MQWYFLVQSVIKILSKNTTNSVIPKTLQPKNESSYYLTKDNELQIL